MSWRRLVPLVLVGLLGVAVAAAAAFKFPAPKSPAVLRLRHNRSCFTPTSSDAGVQELPVHFAGQSTVYRAPIGPGGGAPWLVRSWDQVGHNRFVLVHRLRGRMVEDAVCIPWIRRFFGGAGLPPSALFLQDGTPRWNTYAVRGVLSDLPKALVTLIFTVVVHGPNNQTGDSFTSPHPNRPAKVIGRSRRQRWSRHL